jgi:pilin isopeptide linkage protein
MADVVLDGNGGTYLGLPIPLDDYYPTTLPDETQCYYIGYRLVGWNTEPDGSGRMYQPGSTTLLDAKGANIHLYAIWEETEAGGQYYVREWCQNVDDTDYTMIRVNRHPEEPGAEVTVLPPEHDGLRFVRGEMETGHTTEALPADGKAEFTVADDAVVILNYYYDRNRYALVFDGNGASSGSMDAMNDLVGEVSYLLPRNRFEKVDEDGVSWIFTGWNTASDGSGTHYADGQSVKNLAENGETLTLYAEWYKNENSIEPTNGSFTVTLKAGQKLVVQNLPAGTSYSVTEIRIPDGWTKTADDGVEGTVVSKQTNTGSITNSYAAEGTAEIVAHKQLAGSTLQSGQFSFQLLDESGAVIDTVTNDAPDEVEEIAGENGENIPNPWLGTGPVNFRSLRFQTEGTYRYTIREISGTDSEIVYDTHEEAVTVNVSDKGDGTLKAEVVYDDDGALFENKLEQGELTVTKTTLNATSASANAEFHFAVTLKDASGKALSGSFDVTGADETSVADGGTLTLHGSGSFTISGLPHGASYEVSETDLPGGWTMTSSVNTRGTIDSSATAEVSFENSYSTGGSVKLEAKKHFIGGEIEPEQFEFTLLDGDGTELSKAFAVGDSSDPSWGTIEFPVIGYSQADVGAVHEYVIRETVGSEEGIVYDAKEHRVRVNVSDSGSGYLATQIEYLTDGDTAPDPNQPESGIVFVNRKMVELTVSKTVAGELGDMTRKFDFTIRLFTAGSNGGENVPYVEAVEAPADCDWTAVADKPGQYSFRLGHGQSITIGDLPGGLSYEIVEARVGDYVTKVTVNGGEATETDTAAGVLEKNSTVAYQNTLEGTVDTGVSDASPMLYSAGLGVIALGAYLALKQRRKENEA